MLELNPNYAKAADTINTSIKESGKYYGVITRAEKLVSEKGTPGLGLSFRSDNGETADYLDLYIGETDGKPWNGTRTVNAILCCLKLRQAKEGEVIFEEFNKDTKQRERVKVIGYPEIQGKRIGFLLQKELSEYQGKQKEKMLIYGVFQADTELTASEILEGKTTPERLPKMLQSLMTKPVRDSRGNSHTVQQYQAPNANFDNFDSDIPF